MTQVDHPLDPLFKPKSIAIVGASEKAGVISGMSLRNLIRYGYPGTVYPVNPKYESLLGHTCYPSVLDIPEPIDTALIVVPARAVLSVLKECIKKRVKTVTIVSSGFGEAGGGEAGTHWEEKVQTLAQESGIRILGPNCIGLMNVVDRAIQRAALYLVEDMLPGPVGIVSHSGGVSLTLFNRAQAHKVGISHVAPSGNEVDLEMCDLIDFMIEDPDTKVICAYIEGLKDGRRFLQVARKAIDHEKPIIAVKVGRSQEGKKAAIAHTGALTGSDTAYDAAFQKLAVTRVPDIDALHEAARLFSSSPVPHGNRVGIVTVSGGEAVWAADACTDLGLELPTISPETQRKMDARLRFGKAQNPLDLTGQVFGDPDLLTTCLRLFSEQETLCAVVVIVPTLGSSHARWICPAIIRAAHDVDKPFLVAWWTAGEDSMIAHQLFREADVPAFQTPYRALAALKAYVDYGARLRALQDESPSYPAVAQKDQRLPKLARQIQTAGYPLSLADANVRLLLQEYGIPIARQAAATSPEAAIEAAGEIGYPVVLKVDSMSISHKTEAGGVKADLETPTEVAQAYKEVVANAKAYDPQAAVRGAIVQQLVRGLEVIAGFSVDHQFGPVMLFGIGGVETELWRDTSHRLAPLSEHEAAEMIRGIRGFALLQGYRGQAPADVQALEKILLALSQLAVDYEDSISELDLNPVMVLPDGSSAVVVDARVTPANVAGW